MPRLKHAIKIAAPPEQVWALVHDLEARVKNGVLEQVMDVQRHPDGSPSSYRWSLRVGPTRVEGHSIYLRFEPPRSFQERTEAAGVYGILTGSLVPAETEGNATTVTFEVDLHPAGGPAQRALFPVIRAEIDRMVSNNLRKLKDTLEG